MHWRLKKASSESNPRELSYFSAVDPIARLITHNLLHILKNLTSTLEPLAIMSLLPFFLPKSHVQINSLDSSREEQSDFSPSGI
jgi:hypothetical protein